MKQTYLRVFTMLTPAWDAEIKKDFQSSKDFRMANQKVEFTRKSSLIWSLQHGSALNLIRTTWNVIQSRRIKAPALNDQTKQVLNLM